MRLSRRHFLALSLAFATAACGASRARPDTADPNAVTTLRVVNQGYLDRTIYLVENSQRVRLGQVTGNSTMVLRIPKQYVFGASTLRFIADPIGSNAVSISQSITVSPGDQVELMIPPA